MTAEDGGEPSSCLSLRQRPLASLDARTGVPEVIHIQDGVQLGIAPRSAPRDLLACAALAAVSAFLVNPPHRRIDGVALHTVKSHLFEEESRACADRIG